MDGFELQVNESDELGPGSDLVISMFAVAMLILGIIGFGFLRDRSDTSVANASQSELMTTVNLIRAVALPPRESMNLLTQIRSEIDDE